MTKPKRKVPAEKPQALFGRIVSILDQARAAYGITAGEITFIEQVVRPMELSSEANDA